MKKRRNKVKRNNFLYLSPRVLTILFILFISMFALDIFGNKYSFWETVLGLFMHLIPSFILTLLLIAAWKQEWIGALGFFSFMLWYIFQMRNNLEFPLTPYLIIALPSLVIGILWWINWAKKKQ